VFARLRQRHWAYQVIELPRTRQDPPQGVLRFALGSHTRMSWWERAATYVDENLRQAEENNELGNSTWQHVLGRDEAHIRAAYSAGEDFEASISGK
jgi:hypothetical protein